VCERAGQHRRRAVLLCCVQRLACGCLGAHWSAAVGAIESHSSIFWPSAMEKNLVSPNANQNIYDSSQKKVYDLPIGPLDNILVVVVATAADASTFLF
jgi:uncharacterized protein YvpB